MSYLTTIYGARCACNGELITAPSCRRTKWKWWARIAMKGSELEDQLVQHFLWKGWTRIPRRLGRSRLSAASQWQRLLMISNMSWRDPGQEMLWWFNLIFCISSFFLSDNRSVILYYIVVKNPRFKDDMSSMQNDWRSLASYVIKDDMNSRLEIDIERESFR